MALPRELWDDVVPESTTVIGDVDKFLVYVEQGYAWRDWQSRIYHSLRRLEQDLGMVSPDIVQEILTR